jgi:transcriptional regulator with XRE-family HTH domain
MSELRKIRLLDKKISQFELARLSGVHPSRISRLESGSARPSTNEVHRISEALGLLPEEIFGLEAVIGKLIASKGKGAADQT